MSYTFLAHTDKDKWQETPYNVLDYVGILEYVESHRQKDTYKTINVFREPTTHTRDNIAYVVEIVLDIDSHFNQMTEADAYTMLEGLKPYFNVSIPEPSRLVYSGRGLHYKLSIAQDPDHAKSDLVQRQIAKVLDDVIGKVDALSHTKLKMGYDAIGSERYIRAEGTYNTKAHAYCTAIYSSHAHYTLDQLMTKYLPATEEIVAGKITAQEYTERVEGRVFKQYRKGLTAQTWRYAVIEDLKSLMRSRDAEAYLVNGMYKTQGNNGKRNTMLFMYGLVCKHAYNDIMQVWESMQAYNQCYAHGVLSEHEVMDTYHSIIRHPYRPYSTSKMLTTLEITPTEMQSLKVLIDRTEIKRRKRVRENIAYSQKAQERSSKLEGIKAQAIALHNAGTPYKDIAKQLAISVGKAHYLCN